MNEKFKAPFIMTICAFSLWCILASYILLPMAVFIAVGFVLYALTIFFTAKRAGRKIKSMPYFAGALFLFVFLNAVINNAEMNNLVIPRAVYKGQLVMGFAEVALLVGYLSFVLLKYGDKKQTDKPEVKQEVTERRR